MKTNEAFFVRQQGIERGPVSRVQIEDDARRGRLAPDAEFWCDGMGGWLPVRGNLAPARRRRMDGCDWLIVGIAVGAVVLFGGAAIRTGLDNADVAAGGLLWIFGLIVAGIIYFVPTVLARNHRQFAAIFALNLLLGWTFLGWAVALIWALTKPRP